MDSRQKAIYQRLIDKIVGPSLSGVALFQLKDIPLHDEHATTLFDLLGQYPQPFRLWLENVTPRRCNPTTVPEDEAPIPEPVFGQLSKLLSSTASQLCFLTLNSHALPPDSLQTLVSSLHRHPHLQELTIHHTDLSSPQSAAALSQLLLPDLAPLSLESLSLWDDLISAEGICILSQALKSNTSLLSLNLSRNRASDVGAAALATSLVQNNTLRRLLLFGNQVTDVGCIEMLKKIASNPESGLEEVGMDGNRTTVMSGVVLRDLLRDGLAHFTAVRIDSVEAHQHMELPNEIRRYLQRNAQNQERRRTPLTKLCWTYLAGHGLNMRHVVPEHLYPRFAQMWPTLEAPVRRPFESVRACSVCRSTAHDKRTCPLQPPLPKSRLAAEASEPRKRTTRQQTQGSQDRAPKRSRQR